MSGKKLLLLFVHCLLFVSAQCGYEACEAVKANGCPGVTYNFPNANQVSDYVRYRRYVPRMAEATVCAWIKTAGFRNEVESVLSYAISTTDNELEFHFDGSSRAFLHAGGPRVRFSTPRNLRKFHYCVWFSTIQRRAELYINGTRVSSVARSPLEAISGGGTLVIGQEQDAVNVGSLDRSQAFRGSISNFAIWPRVLSHQEIFYLAAKCECPPDYAVALTIDRSELYGSASYSLPKKCPSYA